MRNLNLYATLLKVAQYQAAGLSLTHAADIVATESRGGVSRTALVNLYRNVYSQTEQTKGAVEK